MPGATAFLPVTVDPMPVNIDRGICSGAVMDDGRIAVAVDLEGISIGAGGEQG